MQSKNRRAWLTPDTEDALADLICRRIFVPDADAFRESVSGAIYELTLSHNWEQYGTMTPEEAALKMLELYNLHALDSGCEGGSGLAPFWDDADADDADDAPPDEDPSVWYEDLADWVVTLFLATSFTPDAAIKFVTTARQIRFWFRKRDYGAIFNVLWDDVVVAEIDTYSATPEAAEFRYYAPTASEHELRIEHSGTYNPDATPLPAGYAIEIVRGRLRIEGLDIRYSPAPDDVVQYSPDGGATWIDSPENDPRNINHFPPIDSDFPNCDAAERMMQHTKEILQNVIDGFTGGATAIAWLIIGRFVPGWGIVIVVIVLLVEGLIALGIEYLTDAFLGDDWDLLKCLFACRIGDDGVMTDEQFDLVYDDITAEFDATQAFVLHQIMSMSGRGGYNDAAFQRTETGDCDGCGCGWCYEFNYLVDSGGLGNVTIYNESGSIFCGSGGGGSYAGGNGWTYTRAIGRNFTRTIFTHVDVDVVVNSVPGGQAPGVVIEMFDPQGGRAYDRDYRTALVANSNTNGTHTFEIDAEFWASEISFGRCTTSGTNVVKRIRFRGKGENPFGEDNCT